MVMSASARPGRYDAKPKRKPSTWETRGSVEVLLAGASAPEPLPVNDLVEADLWDQLPADVSALLALLPRADLYAATMRSNWPFTQPSRASGAAKDGVGNA